jgi:hypothetical protein
VSSANVIDLDFGLAIEAARYSLPLADSVIYATAIVHSATLWTQDEHFQGIAGRAIFRKITVAGKSPSSAQARTEVASRFRGPSATRIPTAHRCSHHRVDFSVVKTRSSQKLLKWQCSIGA